MAVRTKSEFRFNVGVAISIPHLILIVAAIVSEFSHWSWKVLFILTLIWSHAQLWAWIDGDKSILSFVLGMAAIGTIFFLTQT